MTQPTHDHSRANARTGSRRPVRNRDEVLTAIRESEPELRALGATGVFLYGSAARDEMTSDSDVDVFVDYDLAGPFSFVEFLDIKYLLEERFGRDLDFSTRRGLNPRLRAKIEASSLKVV